MCVMMIVVSGVFYLFNESVVKGCYVNVIKMNFELFLF